MGKKFMFLLMALAAGCTWPKSEITTNKFQSDMEVLIGSHTVSVQPEAGKVRLVTDGEIGLPSGGTAPSGGLVLGVGDRMVRKPDHHSYTVFKVSEVKAESVILDYEYKFNHQSFGKNLVTIDRGQVEVGYRN